MITDIGDYFSKGCGRCERFATADCSVQRWMAGLLALRRLCLDAGLVETVKWGHPCYMQAGRNIVLIGAFRGDFSLGFFNAALMKDPHGVLERSGPNTAHADTMRFENSGAVEAMAPVIREYLLEAMTYADTGIKPPRETRDVELPDELVDALDSDPEMAEAFARLTPGRQRSYVINLAPVKKPETRIARIVKFRDKILEGKGAMER